jgi:hypothetical protein
MYVFLSYAMDDRKWAEALADYLMQEGFEVWDPATNVLPGDNPGTEVEKALENSEAMVVVLSPKSMRSHAVNSEIQYALGSSRFKNRLIPVLIGGKVEAPWADFVQVIQAAGRDEKKVGHLVADSLRKSAVKSSR